MSSELFVFDNSFSCDPFIELRCHIPFENLSQGNGSVFVQEKENPFEETLCFDRITCSPPSVQLESLSTSHLRNAEYSGLEVKTEGSQINFESSSGNECSFLPQSVGFDGLDDETAVKFMLRSYSSHCFERSFSFMPQFDSVLECQHLQNHPKKTISSGQLRRVCSTGDLQKMKNNIRSSSADKSLVDESNSKVGRYNTEERKERIDRYRAKRTQRNFNKTIKYACRKTLANNRQRVRGRFARNDGAGEIPKTSIFHGYEDDQYDIWIL